jgi:hypothetical protein
MSQSIDDLKKYIKNEISKSGFPLEIKVAAILSQKGWNVKPHILYPSEGKDKEMDIKATKIHPTKKKCKNMLIVECKKQESKPWIFFEQNEVNKDIFSLNASPFHLYDKLTDYFEKTHYSKQKPCSYHFPSFVERNCKSDPILEAVNQVIDALFYSHNIELELYEKLERNFTFLYPIIVLDGKLFSARIEPDGNIELTESSHLQLKVLKGFKDPFTFRSGTVNYIKSMKPYIIDIVLKDYFSEFLTVFS